MGSKSVISCLHYIIQHTERYKFILVILIIFIPKLEGERNVALGKRSYFCLSQRLDPAVLDGDRFRVESITSSCYPTAFLDVDLMEDVFIHYVVVFIPAAARIAEVYQKMDYFVVEEFLFGRMVPCSEFPGPSIEAVASRGMVVNCRPHPATNKIRIESRKDEGMVLSEIEVYTLGQDQHNTMVHVGCFSAFRGTQKPDCNIYDCFILCRYTNLLLAVKNKQECFCGDLFDPEAEVNAIECLYRCPGLDRSCGGADRFSVYIANVHLPYYVGCYDIIHLDEITRISRGDMHPGRCIKHCEDTDYAIVWAESNCGCSAQLEPTLNSTDYYDCNNICSGDGNKICGGDTEASVYKTCYTNRSNQLKCSLLFHCKDEWDESGLCTTICVSGFVGSHCLTKPFLNVECSNVTDLCRDFPNTKCVSRDDSLECQCLDGFEKNASGICQEIDLCVTANPCLEKPNTLCVKVTPTEYSCECIDGYELNTHGDCIENQCHSNPCQNQTNVECISGADSYNCSCFPGFYRIDPTNPTDQCIENQCHSNPCLNQTNVKCISGADSYNCSCVPGFYRIDPTNPTDQCIVDGCYSEPCRGDHFTVCVRANGSHTCECIEGYYRNERRICVVDYCFDEPCANITNSECKNLNGGFECNCMEGFYKDDVGFCQIDHCYVNPCNVNETFTTCLIQLDSFICLCIAGYYRNHLNECAVDHCYGDPCFNQTSTACERRNDTYLCNCFDRFYKDESNVCKEDLCLDEPCGNETHEICIRRPGSFRCVCEENYFRNLSGDCVEMDRCLTEENPCINNTFSFCKKINLTIYKCICLEGFEVKDVTDDFCEDINECELNLCDKKTTHCENNNGSYICECKLGYERESLKSCKVGPPKSWFSDNYYARLIFFIMVPLISLFLICLFTSLTADS